jgi:hypothetical protein
MPGFKVDVRHALGGLIASLEARTRDVEFWTAAALTATAKDVEAAEVAKMAEVFDRPTRFTLNALYVKPATRGDLVAEVRFKEGFGSIPAWHYLGPEVEGGPRKHKSHELRLIRAGLMHADEFAVPGKGIKLDANGNMKASDIERILSQVGAAEQMAGYKANATKGSLARAKRKGVGRYFLLRPDASDLRYQRRHVRAGIYYRKGLHDLVPVIVFVKAPKYSKRLPFYETAREVIAGRFETHFRAAMAKYPPKAR